MDFETTRRDTQYWTVIYTGADTSRNGKLKSQLELLFYSYMYLF